MAKKRLPPEVVRAMLDLWSVFAALQRARTAQEIALQKQIARGHLEKCLSTLAPDYPAPPPPVPR